MQGLRNRGDSVRTRGIILGTGSPAFVHPEILFGMTADHLLQSRQHLLGQFLQVVFLISCFLKMSFRAIIVVGNEKGQVGVGVGKAGDVIGAVRKGVAEERI